ncbi:MAG: PDZ domain-containing protein [Planctomycetes bacterium]|nr:PDZ domain-containing protein [Planctomycetota bacterium]
MNLKHFFIRVILCLCVVGTVSTQIAFTDNEDKIFDTVFKLIKDRGVKDSEKVPELLRSLVKNNEVWAAKWVLDRAKEVTPENQQIISLTNEYADKFTELEKERTALISKAKGEASYFNESRFGISFTLFLPPNFDTNKQLPLIIFNHGAGYDGPLAMIALQTEFGKNAILICPTNAVEHNDEVIKLTCWAVCAFNADPTAIFVGGHSLGGVPSYSIALQYPEIFAGVFTVFCPFNEQVRQHVQIEKRTEKINLPILMVLGELDKAFSYSKEEMDDIQAYFEELGYTNTKYEVTKQANHMEVYKALSLNVGPWMEKVSGKKIIGGILPKDPSKIPGYTEMTKKTGQSQQNGKPLMKLGILVKEVTDPASGLQIINMIQNGPAWQSGLRIGDIITSINGTNISSTEELRQILKTNEEEKLSCTYKRIDGTELKEMKTNVAPRTAR